MSHALSQGVRTFSLIFGVVEALGATLWCLGGAGIYGSLLGMFRGLELAHLWAFLIIGPFSALLAAVVALWRARWGAAWLITSGLASGALAIPYLSTDAHILPLAFVSLPMIVVGLWLIRASARASGFGAGAGHPIEPGGQPDARGGMGSILFGVLLFLVAAVGTYTLLSVLAVNNVTGLRGKPRPDNPFVQENQDLADGVVVLLVAALIGLITLVRKRLRLRGEAVAGMWLAVLLGGLIILIR
jgi:hypothetical protein